ncbi:MAG: putative holin-like toxin [Novosphingobium sp.]
MEIHDTVMLVLGIATLMVALIGLVVKLIEPSRK